MFKRLKSHKLLRNLKSQAAMEFLMTYGWAILVVLVAIGALAYFGVLNPAKFLPSSCIITPGISCEDHLVKADGTASIIIRNGMGVTLNNLNMSIGNTWGTPSCGSSLADGDTCTFTFTGLSNVGGAGTKFKADINFTYQPTGGTNHTKVGSITTNVES
jgi:hypothetical protein